MKDLKYLSEEKFPKIQEFRFYELFWFFVQNFYRTISEPICKLDV